MALSDVAPHERVVPIGGDPDTTTALLCVAYDAIAAGRSSTASPNERGVGLRGVAMVQSVCATDSIMLALITFVLKLLAGFVVMMALMA